MSECTIFSAGVVGGLFLLIGILGWMSHRERMQELRNARPDQ